MGGDELDRLERQVTEIEHEERELTLVEQRLEAQIETFFARREVIAARYSTAEAHVEVREALGGVSDELAGLGTALERAEQTTDRMQARASALDHLADLGVLDDPGVTAWKLTQRRSRQASPGRRPSRKSWPP